MPHSLHEGCTGVAHAQSIHCPRVGQCTVAGNLVQVFLNFQNDAPISHWNTYDSLVEIICTLAATGAEASISQQLSAGDTSGAGPESAAVSSDPPPPFLGG